MTKLKIISGGQTGADMGALIAAKELGVETGGTAPKGYRTEKGKNPTLETVFGLEQSISPDYPVRTVANVRDSDVSVVLSCDTQSAGTAQTISCCRNCKKDFTVNNPFNPFAVFEIYDFLQEKIAASRKDTFVINVAGNRESVYPGIEAKVSEVMAEVIRKLNERFGL